MYRKPSTRSGMPVSARNPVTRGMLGGVESYRVRLMKKADTKKDAAFTTNATFLPARAVTRPPTDAPIASIADHAALERALAGINSAADVRFGIVAVLAGSKNADAETVRDMTA